MIRTRFKKVLLVAPEIFPNQLLADYTNVRHVTASGSVFPSIYEQSPDVIVFDYDFMGKELEKTLRRIKANKFYSKIKICCFKNVANEKTDSFLKVLGGGPYDLPRTAYGKLKKQIVVKHVQFGN